MTKKTVENDPYDSVAYEMEGNRCVCRAVPKESQVGKTIDTEINRFREESDDDRNRRNAEFMSILFGG